MPPKIKPRPAGEPATTGSEQPTRAHDPGKLLAAANPASRRPRLAPPSTVLAASHARHHVGRQAQA